MINEKSDHHARYQVIVPIRFEEDGRYNLVTSARRSPGCQTVLVPFTGSHEATGIGDTKNLTGLSSPNPSRNGMRDGCPGDHESGGKRKSGKTRKGNRHLRVTLVQCAHAVGRSKKHYRGARCQRLAKRKGKQRAAIAVAHDLLEAAYFILRDGVVYQDLGPDYFDRLQREHLVKYHTKRSQELGVTVTPAETVAA